MKRLIMILTVFSLAWLSAGVAVAHEDMPPGPYHFYVDIGTLETENQTTMGDPPLNMVGWGPTAPGTIGGNYGGFNVSGETCRPVWSPTEFDLPHEPWADIDLDFGGGGGGGTKTLYIRYLDGASTDDQRYLIDGLEVGSVTTGDPGENWYVYSLDVSGYAGVHTLRIEATQSEGSYWDPYGQVAIDQIGITIENLDPVIEPIAVDSDPISCSGSKTVNFHYTPGGTDLRGYSVRVECDAELTFDETDVTFFEVPTGVTYQSYVTEITAGHVYNVDYAILGGSVGISEEADLFSVDFHGVATGLGEVSITSVSLAALDGTPVTPVIFSGTASIDVDCDAPDVPVMDAEPAFTPGNTNEVSWSDVSAHEYEVEMADNPAFTSPVSSGWIGGTSHTFGPVLEDGQIYYYHVRARDELENTSGWSGDVSSTQDASPPETAAAVTDPDADGWVESFFDVTYSGSDATSGIASVELFYRIDGGSYTSYGTFSGTTINFDASGLAEGTYDFYTIATDNVGNEEPVPGAPDDSINVDKTPPATSVDALPATTGTASFTVSYTLDVEDGSGLDSVDLWFKKGIGGTYTNYGTFSGTSMTFDSSTWGDGEYYFYSIGTDMVGNEELPPTGPDYDTFTLVDTAGPQVTSFLINNDDTYTTSTGVTLSMTVTDVEDMQFSNDNTNWSGWVGYAATYPWTLAPGDGTKTVYAQFRDAALNIGYAQDDIILDATAPGAVSDLAAATGHNKITVTWTNPGDGETDAEVYRHMWYWDDPDDDPDMGNISAYPEYDDVNDYTPTRPVSRAAADADPLWVLAASTAVPGTPFVDDPLERGIYYYEVFLQDEAGNWSDPADDYAYNLSYLLGDVADDDGIVHGADITVLGAAYGTSDGPPPYNNECDVGPTDDYSGSGIPTTDDLINFQDLMVFALNWDVEVTKMQPTEGSMIARFSWEKVEARTWSLVLNEPCANLKGVNLQADLGQDDVLSVSAGHLLGQQDSPYFLQNIPRNGLDAGLALLGNGACIAGRGELIRVHLAGNFDLDDIVIIARDSSNKDLEYSLEETTASGDMPTRYALSANYPNPFNPSTNIDFSLPESQNVQLAIFAVDGRRVATLKNGSMPAGNHTVTWTGHNDQGGIVAAGIYFYRIKAGDFSQTRKMTLLK